MRGVAAVAWSALFASSEPIYKSGGACQHREHNTAKTPTLIFCDPFFPLECLTCLYRGMLMPFHKGLGHLWPVHVADLPQCNRQKQLNEKQDEQRLSHGERKGQRRGPAPDDARFVSKRIGWFPFAGLSCWPFLCVRRFMIE